MIIHGDSRTALRELDKESIQTCVTSPPFWKLRDYQVEGQLGREPTPEQYVEDLVAILGEVKRVLRDDGTLWLNLGDTFVSKNLVGIPWRVAFALQERGWVLRADVIWSKPNPRPQSTRDRPTGAHEYLFLLTKRRRYYYNADAIREPHKYGGRRERKKGGWVLDGAGRPGADGRQHLYGNPLGRNKRSVWTIPTRPFPDAHFAVFPPDLVEPCILAGSAPRACAACGAPWRQVAGERRLDLSRPQARRAAELADGAGLTPEHLEALRSVGISDAGKAQITQDGTGRNRQSIQALADEAKAALGGYSREFLLARPAGGVFQSDCEHDNGEGGSIVLDPFVGSGTTGEVAQRLGREFIGVDLNPTYVEMARERCSKQP